MRFFAHKIIEHGHVSINGNSIPIIRHIRDRRGDALLRAQSKQHQQESLKTRRRVVSPKYKDVDEPH